MHKLQKPEILFARHGQTDYNKQGILAGQINAKLTEEGIRQAVEAGRMLRGRGEAFDVIASTELHRANHTAHIIANELGYRGEIRMLPELNERNGGSFQGRPVDEFYAASDEEIVAAGGESATEFSDRIRAGSMLLAAFTAGRVLFVGHAEAYRMKLANQQGLKPELYETLEKPKNAQIYPFPMPQEAVNQHRINTQLANKYLSRGQRIGRVAQMLSSSSL